MKTRRLLTICLSAALPCSVVDAGGTAPSNAIQVVTAPVAAVVSTSVAVAAPAVVTAATAPQPPVDEAIEIGYIEADIQNVLRTLAAKAGVNLILGDEVAGKVTVNLKGISYEGA